MLVLHLTIRLKLLVGSHFVSFLKWCMCFRFCQLSYDPSFCHRELPVIIRCQSLSQGTLSPSDQLSPDDSCGPEIPASSRCKQSRNISMNSNRL
ncbi:unnamed protein product [Sympodiomycopsis kandeliae]